MSQIRIIIGREFNERVRKKSFIVSTLLMPVLLLGLMLAPALIMQFSRGETKRIAVIDRSGLVLPQLESDSELAFEATDLPLDRARRELTDRFGILWIGPDPVAQPDDIRLYANASSSISIESNITGQIEKIVENEKLKGYDIENLAQILDEVRTRVTMQTFRNDESQEEDSAARSSAAATVAGFALGMLLYMFLLIYGAMVMQSVIEEKHSRVLEVMVSSVRPFDLMMGKILGIASVAVVQILLWGALVLVAGTVVLPRLLPADVLAGMQAAQGGDAAAAAQLDPALLTALGTAMDAGYIAALLGWLLLFLVGGYLLYSAMFAAVGSAVDNVQDSQQLQTPITIPIILAFLAAMSVMNDPNSAVAFWFSIIPFTSPVVMMTRIPCGIPLWEILLSLVLLYASFVAMVWLAAKIYRVGIFMHGKKPTLRELYKWCRYKY